MVSFFFAGPDEPVADGDRDDDGYHDRIRHGSTLLMMSIFIRIDPQDRVAGLLSSKGQEGQATFLGSFEGEKSSCSPLCALLIEAISVPLVLSFW